MKVTAGKFIATPNDWGIGESKEKKTPFAYIDFVFEDSMGLGSNLRWTGYLTEKTKKRTLQSLLYCGFKGSDLEDLILGSAGGALNPKQKVEIVVSLETNEKGTFPRIQWVNQIGGSKFENLTPPSEAKAIIKKLNLKADLMELRKEIGENAPPPVLDDSEPIPF